ncbi:hypothetical protein [Paenibacillus macerans]|uniref:hypothetical protein n=1 Tax=Paenibacillus macerans TaxID=44252 RepID=UPI00203CE1F7|nr:hypothetical protein [Paenibacillus macerans]MCM3703796.1 hypothetical protein [Paenibacillus macerans]
MNYFEDITPDNRWKNEMLNEQRETNSLLRQLLESAPKQEKVTELSEIKPKRQYNRREKGVVNQ